MEKIWDDQSKSEDNQEEQNMKIEMLGMCNNSHIITKLIKYLETQIPSQFKKNNPRQKGL